VQEDAEFRQVTELLVAVAERAAVAGSDDAVNQEIRDWLFRLAESDVDLQSILAENLERAFPI
jgi:hypothetical protein